MTDETDDALSIHDEIKEVAPIRCGLKDLSCLRAPRQKHHHRGVVPASLAAESTTLFHDHHDAWHWHPQEMYAIVVLSGGTTIFPRDGWAHDEWADGACCIHDEIKVVAEHFRSVEVLFQPSIIGKEAQRPTTRRGYPQRVVRQCRVVRWHSHLSMDHWAHDEGTDGIGSLHGEGQGGCSDLVRIGGLFFVFPQSFFFCRCGPGRARAISEYILCVEIDFVSSKLHWFFPSRELWLSCLPCLRWILWMIKENFKKWNRITVEDCRTFPVDQQWQQCDLDKARIVP